MFINVYELLELRRRGWTLKALSYKFDVPREKIQQMLKKLL